MYFFRGLKPEGNDNGFTLIELLVVISIISLLSSIVLASLSAAREKGRIAGGIYFAGYNYHKLGVNVIGRWKLDEEPNSTVAIDSSDNKNNLTLSGATFEANSNPLGAASSLYLNGGYAEALGIVNGPSLVGQGTQGFTISMWIKFTDPTELTSPSLIPFISLCRGSCTSFPLAEFAYFYSTGVGGLPQQMINFRSTIAGSPPVGFDRRVITSNFPKLNSWQQLTISFNGTSINIYVDGHFSGTTISQASNTSPIGSIVLGYTGKFIGYMSDVIIYNELLTADQIRNIYAEGLPTHGRTAER